MRFQLQSNWYQTAALMQRYSVLPGGKKMSLADATLVRLAELHDQASVFTLDSDFNMYRKNRRQQIRLIAPWTFPN